MLCNSHNPLKHFKLASVLQLRKHPLVEYLTTSKITRLILHQSFQYIVSFMVFPLESINIV
jgi:hypothetical protein